MVTEEMDITVSDDDDASHAAATAGDDKPTAGNAATMSYLTSLKTWLSINL